MLRIRLVIVLGLLVFYSTKSSALDSVRRYYDLVNSAELAIVDSFYSQALIDYELAFELLDYPFDRDVYNALHCSLIEKKYVRTKELCHLLAGRGIGKPYFEKPIFNPMKKSKGWDKLLNLASDREAYFKKISFELRQRIEELLKIDQEIAHESEKWRKSGRDSTKEYAAFIPKQDSISNELLKLVEEYGFIGSRELGIANPFGSVFSSGFKFDVIFIHTIQRSSFKNKLRLWKLIEGQLASGRLETRRLEHMAAMSGFYDLPFIDLHRFWIIKDCNIYKRKMPGSMLHRIEYFRKNHYLCSFDNYLKKSIYMFKHPKSNFRFLLPIKEIRINEIKSEWEKGFYNNSYQNTNVKLEGCD